MSLLLANLYLYCQLCLSPFSKPISVLSVISLSFQQTYICTVSYVSLLLAKLDLYCQLCLSHSQQTWMCTVSYVSLLLANLDLYCQFCFSPSQQTYICSVSYVSSSSNPRSVLSVISLSFQQTWICTVSYVSLLPCKPGSVLQGQKLIIFSQQQTGLLTSNFQGPS